MIAGESCASKAISLPFRQQADSNDRANVSIFLGPIPLCPGEVEARSGLEARRTKKATHRLSGIIPAGGRRIMRLTSNQAGPPRFTG
jgi:hypothetical protein